MKKFLALCLTFCMFLTCTSTAVFASEPSSDSALQTEDTANTTDELGIMPLNTDYWTTQLLYIGEKGFTQKIKVPKGKNLKVHFALSKLFLEKMGLYVQVLQNGSYKTIAHWTTEGHHWADIVTNTKGGVYTIRLVGPAYVSGGFYSEP